MKKIKQILAMSLLLMVLAGTIISCGATKTTARNASPPKGFNL